MTTAEQREAWKQVHVAIANYIIRYGEITLDGTNNALALDLDSRFVECGKISCPNSKEKS